jgi:hypothetical protein
MKRFRYVQRQRRRNPIGEGNLKGKEGERDPKDRRNGHPNFLGQYENWETLRDKRLFQWRRTLSLSWWAFHVVLKCYSSRLGLRGKGKPGKKVSRHMRAFNDAFLGSPLVYKIQCAHTFCYKWARGRARVPNKYRVFAGIQTFFPEWFEWKVLEFLFLAAANVAFVAPPPEESKVHS